MFVNLKIDILDMISAFKLNKMPYLLPKFEKMTFFLLIIFKISRKTSLVFTISKISLSATKIIKTMSP